MVRMRVSRNRILTTHIGKITIKTRAYRPSTQMEFCFSTIHLGRAIPTCVAGVYNSGVNNLYYVIL